MFRLGKYTGKIYEDGTNINDIKECCDCLPDNKRDDSEYIDGLRTKNKLECFSCITYNYRYHYEICDYAKKYM